MKTRTEVRRWHLQCGAELPRRLSQQSSRDEAQPSVTQVLDVTLLSPLSPLSTLQIAGIAAPCRVRFETEMWHPNIYPDGRVCISILHPPGTDRFNDQAKPWWEVSAGAARLTQVLICFPSGNRWRAVATYPGSSQHFDQCATLRCPLKLVEPEKCSFGLRIHDSGF